MSDRANINRVRRGRGRSAFTLIELMVVIGIIVVVMSMAIPSGYKLLNKEGMPRAVEVVTEACQYARAQAIFKGHPVDLMIYPQEKRFEVSSASGGVRERGDRGAIAGASGGESPVPPALKQKGMKGGSYSATLPAEISMAMVDVNYVEYKDTKQAAVRFYPNGTSDKFTVILHKNEEKWHTIALDVITALPDVTEGVPGSTR